MKKELIQEWEDFNDKLAEYFALKYFGKDTEVWWIAGESGGVLYINDRFFSPQDMIDYLRYSYSKDKMFEHYDYSLACREKEESPINIKNYRQLVV
jgi:hypothetical protein